MHCPRAVLVVGGVQYLLVVSMRSALVWFYLFDMTLVLLMAIAMNNYHAVLIMRNLTTNEDMNKHRYTYLRDDMNKFRNPFSRGAMGNCCEFLGRRSAVLANPYAANTPRPKLHALHVHSIPSSPDVTATVLL